MSTSEPSERTALENTVTRVAHCIDRKAWRELRELFADEVRTDYTSLFGGKPQEQPGDALIDSWRRLLAPIVTQHLLGPITLSIEGASATAHCHVRGYHFVKGAPGGDEWMVAGHYVMKLAKDSSAWRIRSLTLETFYQSGNLKLIEVAGGR